MAKWIEIEVVDDDEPFGVSDIIVCSNCYWNRPNGQMYQEAPENYKQLEKCPVCGALIDKQDE